MNFANGLPIAAIPVHSAFINIHPAPRPFPPTSFFTARDSHMCSVIHCFALLLFVRFNRFKPIVQFSLRSIHFLLNLLQTVRTLSSILEGMLTLFKYFKHSGPAAEDSKVLPKLDGPLAALVFFTVHSIINKIIQRGCN